MKQQLQHIDSDILDPFFHEAMTEEDKKYYRYFNNLWNKGFHDGSFFDKKHAKEIQKMVWSKAKKNDIYNNYERLSLDWSQHEVDDVLQPRNHPILPIDIADTLATHEGAAYAIAYVADYLKDYDPLQDLQGNITTWIAVIGRIVTEERKAKRNKSLSLGDLTLNEMTYSGKSGVDKAAAKLLKKNTAEGVLQNISQTFVQELNDAGSDVLRRQMLFDKGLLVASIIKKGYNRKRNKK